MNGFFFFLKYPYPIESSTKLSKFMIVFSFFFWFSWLWVFRDWVEMCLVMVMLTFSEKETTNCSNLQKLWNFLRLSFHSFSVSIPVSVPVVVWKISQIDDYLFKQVFFFRSAFLSSFLNRCQVHCFVRMKKYCLK